MSKVTLIVEENHSSGRGLQHMLEEIGYACRVVNSGEQALETVDAMRPALVITDANLPDMSGYELTSRIKASSTLPQTPVILADSLFDSDDLIRGLISGADNFLLKPCDRDSLEHALQQTLATHVPDSSPPNGVGVEITFRGGKHRLKTDPVKTIELLLSTQEMTMQRVGQLLDGKEALQRRLDEAVSSQRFLDSMIENNPNVISIKDADTLRYIRINRAFEKLTGIQREEIIGKSDADLFPHEDANLCVAIDNRALHHEGELASLWLTLLPNGERVNGKKNRTNEDQAVQP